MKQLRISIKPLLTAIIMMLAFSLTTTSCHRLSKQAKAMIGNYYIPEISEDDPLLELRSDATCTIRAIKPSVLTYAVDGTWDVVDDSIVATLKPETLKSEGDTTLIGEIPIKYARKITGFNGLTLTIEKDGVHYVYHRRNE